MPKNTTNDGLLWSANEALTRARAQIEELKRNNDGRAQLVASLAKDLVQILKPSLQAMMNDVRAELRHVKQPVVQVDVSGEVAKMLKSLPAPIVNVPDVYVPKADPVQVRIPDIRIPPVDVKMPEIKVPDIIFPSSIGITDPIRLDHSRNNPVPVMLVDVNGNPIDGIGGGQVIMGGGGGRSKVSTEQLPARGFGNGRKTVTSAGTPEALSSTSKAIRKLIVSALTDNTDVIYVGDKTVRAADGSESGVALYASNTIELNIADLKDVFIDVRVGGEGVSYYFET